MLLTVHLKMVNMVSFKLCISYDNKNPYYLQFWAPLKKPTYLGARHFNLDTYVLRMESLKSHMRLEVLGLWNHIHSLSLGPAELHTAPRPEGLQKFQFQP